MKYIGTLPIVLLISTSIIASPSPDALRDGELRQQQLRQRVQIVGDQLDAIITEFEHNGLGGGDDVKALRAIRSVLGELTDREMQQVVDLLRQSRGDGVDDATARKHVGDAYVAQQTIIARLRGLLAEFHRQQSLYDLAARIQALAVRQDANLKTAVDVAKSVMGRSPENYPDTVNDSLRIQAGSQQTLNADISDALDVVRFLADKADGPSAARLRDAMQAVEKSALPELLTNALNDLRGGNLYRAATGEKSIRDSLQQIATLLGPQTESLAALRNAADDLDHLIQQQREVQDQTRAARSRDLPDVENRQGELVDRTDVARQELEKQAPQAAEAVKAAQDQMQQARADLRERRQPTSIQRQDAAIRELQRAKSQLQQQIAQAEQQQKENAQQARADDAKNNLDRAKDLLEKVKSLREKQDQLAGVPSTQPAAEAKQETQLQDQARQLQQQAAQDNPDASKNLGDAAHEMQQASDNLSKNRQQSAKADQKDASEALSKAEQALAKRADELAKVQDELKQARAAAARRGRSDEGAAEDQLRHGPGVGAAAARAAEQSGAGFAAAPVAAAANAAEQSDGRERSPGKTTPPTSQQREPGDSRVSPRTTIKPVTG
jgi:hypothetical protein